jgi:hypothetical protein
MPILREADPPRKHRLPGQIMTRWQSHLLIFALLLSFAAGIVWAGSARLSFRLVPELGYSEGPMSQSLYGPSGHSRTYRYYW